MIGRAATATPWAPRQPSTARTSRRSVSPSARRVEVAGMTRRFFALLAGALLLGAVPLGSSPLGATASKVGPLPDTTLTPGAKDDNVTQESIAQTICVPGYTKSVRKVSTKTKTKVFAE